MILHDINGGRMYVDRASVTSARAARDGAMWHGIFSIVHLSDGRVLEVRDRIDDVLKLLEANDG